MVQGRDSTRGDRPAGASAPAVLASSFPPVYAELKGLAHAALRRMRPGATLSTTGLVHEAWLKLVDAPDLRLESREHLLALCARAMRQIVVDHARRRLADKRGGGRTRLSLSAVQPDSGDRPEQVLALDEAISALAERDPRLVELIELRVFAGLSTSEAADVLDLSVRSVQRDWLRARAWIGAALMTDPAPPAAGG